MSTAGRKRHRKDTHQKITFIKIIFIIRTVSYLYFVLPKIDVVCMFLIIKACRKTRQAYLNKLIDMLK